MAPPQPTLLPLQEDRLPDWSYPEGAFPFLPKASRVLYRAPVEPIEIESFKEPTLPAFFSEEEVQVYREIAAEYYTLMYPKIPIIRIDRDRSPLDDPVLESSEKVWLDPVYVPAHVQWDPDVHYLSKFGIEVEQDVLLTIPDILLEEAGVEDFEEELVGAVIVVPPFFSKSRYYSVRTVHKGPDDAITPMGDIYNVTLALDIHRTSVGFPQFKGNHPEPDDSETLFYGDEEMDFLRGIYEEGYRTVFPTVQLQVLDRDKTQVDTLPYEADNPVYKDPVHVPGYVRWNPTVFDLRSFGIEHEQEVLITFPTDMLMRATELDDLRDFEGSIITLDLVKNGKRKEYTVLSVHYQPSDAVSTKGYVPQVAVSVDLYKRTLRSESPYAPQEHAEKEEPFIEDYYDPDEDLGIR